MSTWEESPAAPAHAEDCNCDEALAEMWAYLDAELEGPEADRVRAHLAGCRGCLEEYDVEVVVKKLVRRCYQGDEHAPVELREKVHARLVAFLELRAVPPPR